ncbi:MAG: hypothetical protein ACXWT1_05495 [Methylobacter sp.]
MIDASQIKSTTPNTNGRNLLSIFNRVINLAHVTEIIFNSKEKSITIKFVNNTEFTQELEKQAYLSKIRSILFHCIQNDLFDIELTEEANRKWDEYAAKEFNSRVNG